MFLTSKNLATTITVSFVDVNFVLRKVGKATKANEEWSIEGNMITLKITSTFKNKTLTFELGQEIDEETMDGRKVKVKIS